MKKVIIGAACAAWLAVLSAAFAAAPANDQFAGAIAFTGASGNLNGTLVDSTTELREPLKEFDGSVWYKWVAPSSGAAVIDTAGSNADTALAAYTGSTVQSLTSLAKSFNNPTDGSFQARLVFPVVAGTTYYIQVVSDDFNPDTFTISWAIAASGAISFTTDAVRVFEGTDAVLTLTVQRIGPAPDAVTVQYTVNAGTATNPTDYTTTLPTTLSFAAGETVKSIVIPIVNDKLLEPDESFNVVINSVTGGTAVPGNILNVTATLVGDDDDPAFDSFAKAQPIVGTSLDSPFSFTGADLDPGEPDLANGSAVVWFKWTAPASGALRLKLFPVNDLADGPLVTVFRIYTGNDLSSLVQSGAGRSDTGALDLQVQQGVTYRIAVSAEDPDPTSPVTGTFFLSLASGPGGTISAKDFSVNEAAGTATLILTRNTTAGTATASVFPQFGTATLGLDFSFDSTDVTFAPGETQKLVTIPIVNDFEKEGDESYNFGISTAGDVFSETFPVVMTIVDDDDDPANDLFANAQTLPGASGTVSGTVIGSGLESGEPQPVTKPSPKGTVWYRWTATGTGIASFVLTPTKVSFFHVYTGSTLGGLVDVTHVFAGAGANTFRIPVTNGTVYQIAVSDAGNGAGDFTLSWGIDLTASLFTISAPALANEEGGPITVTVTRQGSLATPAGVSYATVGIGAATPNQDFATTSGVLSFAAGVSTQTFTVGIIGDTAVEGDESFSVALSAPTGTGAALGSVSTAFVTIVDNDDDPANDLFANATAIAGASGSINGSNEGAGRETGEPEHGGGGDGTTVWYRWTAPASGEVTFHASSGNIVPLLAAYSGSNVAALTPLAAGFDVIGNGTADITFPVSSGVSYSIAIDSDGTPGDTFTLSWSLRAPGSFQFATATFTGSEANASAIITVSRTGGSAGPASVDYASTDGTALEGSDYTAVSGTLVFDSGETSKTFSVPILGDSIFEQPETVLLKLSKPTNLATISNDSATLTITDDDPLIPLKTAYTGLISPTVFDQAFTGGLTLKTGSKGEFSGSLVIGGKKFSFKDVFAPDGTVSVTITRKGAPALTLKLALTAGGDRIVGTLSDGTVTAQVDANRNVFASDVPATAFSGNYTVVVPGDSNAIGVAPKGDGYATLNISTNGLAKFVGSLADGTTFTFGVQVSKDGDLPLYIPLYKGAGSLNGLLKLRTKATSDGDGPVNWFKPAVAGAKSFPAGFYIGTTSLISNYRYIRGQRVLPQLDATNGAAKFSASLGNLPPPGISQVFNLSESNKVSLPLTPAVTLTLKFATKTGAFSGTFKGSGGLTPFKGAFFRAQGSGSGFFVSGPTESGFVKIEPAK